MNGRAHYKQDVMYNTSLVNSTVSNSDYKQRLKDSKQSNVKKGKRKLLLQVVRD